MVPPGKYPTQIRNTALPLRAIQNRKFLKQNRQRPPIKNKMMVGQQKHMTTRAKSHHSGPDQRTIAQIKTSRPVCRLQQLNRAIDIRDIRLRLNQKTRHRRAADNTMTRRHRGRRNNQAKNFVARYQASPRTTQRSNIQRPLKMHRKLNVVGISHTLSQGRALKDKAFLKTRQRNQIFKVGITIRKRFKAILINPCQRIVRGRVAIR